MIAEPETAGKAVFTSAHAVDLQMMSLAFQVECMSWGLSYRLCSSILFPHGMCSTSVVSLKSTRLLPRTNRCVLSRSMMYHV